MTKHAINTELKKARKAVNAINMKSANWEAEWDAKMVRVRELTDALAALETPRPYTSIDGDIWSV